MVSRLQQLGFLESVASYYIGLVINALSLIK